MNKLSRHCLAIMLLPLIILVSQNARPEQYSWREPMGVGDEWNSGRVPLAVDRWGHTNPFITQSRRGFIGGYGYSYPYYGGSVRPYGWGGPYTWGGPYGWGGSGSYRAYGNSVCNIYPCLCDDKDDCDDDKTQGYIKRER